MKTIQKIILSTLCVFMLAALMVPLATAQASTSAPVSFLVRDADGNAVDDAIVNIYEDNVQRTLIDTATTNQFGLANFNLTNGKDYIVEAVSADGVLSGRGEFTIPAGNIRPMFLELPLGTASFLTKVASSQYMMYVYVLIVIFTGILGYVIYKMFIKKK